MRTRYGARTRDIRDLVSSRELYALAEAEDLDARTVARALRGESVRPSTVRRIARAAQRLGVAIPIPTTTGDPR